MTLTKGGMLKTAAAAVLSLASLGGASLAHSQPYYGGGVSQYRCDSDGDRCGWYRCDPDGDDCRRVSGYNDYNRYDYNGYYNRYGYSGYNNYGYNNYRDQWRCDSDGDRCAWFRCDRDGDSCRRISGWQNRY